MVTVRASSGELTEEIVGAHGVVVMCGRTGEEVSKWDAFCHKKVCRPRRVRMHPLPFFTQINRFRTPVCHEEGLPLDQSTNLLSFVLLKIIEL